MSARILVVEDEEALTTLLRYNLDAEGYDVETVGRGDDADTRLKERVPDLIVLDWMLPGLSGIELCRRLRARPETRQLPIIMLTARGEESERVRGLATGADDYIVKPFSVPELLARVKGLLRRASPERLATVLTYGDIAAGCSAASSCSTASGAAISISMSAPWTCTSGDCVNCSTPAASRIRSAPCAAPAMRWMIGLRKRRSKRRRLNKFQPSSRPSQRVARMRAR